MKTKRMVMELKRSKIMQKHWHHMEIRIKIKGIRAEVIKGRIH